MLKSFLRLFAYVRELEDLRAQDGRVIHHMNRYINDLETLKKAHEERIDYLEDDLKSERARAETAINENARYTIEIFSLRRQIGELEGGRT